LKWQKEHSNFSTFDQLCIVSRPQTSSNNTVLYVNHRYLVKYLLTRRQDSSSNHISQIFIQPNQQLINHPHFRRDVASWAVSVCE
jgi:hypothetical protein